MAEPCYGWQSRQVEFGTFYQHSTSPPILIALEKTKAIGMLLIARLESSGRQF